MFLQGKGYLILNPASQSLLTNKPCSLACGFTAVQFLSFKQDLAGAYGAGCFQADVAELLWWDVFDRLLGDAVYTKSLTRGRVMRTLQYLGFPVLVIHEWRCMYNTSV